MQCTGYTAVHIAAYLLQTNFRPFGTKVDNRLETVGLTLLCGISICLVGFPPPYTTAVKAMIAFLVLPFSLGMVIYCLAKALKKFKDKYRDHRISILLSKAFSRGSFRMSTVDSETSVRPAVALQDLASPENLSDAAV